MNAWKKFFDYHNLINIESTIRVIYLIYLLYLTFFFFFRDNLKEKRERDRERMLKNLNRFFFRHAYKVGSLVGVGSFVFLFYKPFKMIITGSIDGEEIDKGRFIGPFLLKNFELIFLVNRFLIW